jgi:3-deoxy-D-manno-octulosonic-acid transferase
MSWLLNIAYILLLIAVSPVLLYRMLAHGKYRDGWGEKLLGRLPARSSYRPCLWFHAVSVGEVLQLQSVLRELEPQLPGHDFVITTTTVTGLSVAREKFAADRHHVCYFPLDFSWAVGRALDVIQPRAIVLVELELWPNFIAAAGRRGIPLALINGRISERSFRGYRRIRVLMRWLLQRFETLAVQNETYGRRLTELGAPADRVVVTGSIKFDGVNTNRNNPQTAELRRSFGIGQTERVFVAGSTQAPEEDVALQSWMSLREEFPELRLILVPRHKERFEEVAELVRSHGLPLQRRTEKSNIAVGNAVPGVPRLLTDPDHHRGRSLQADRPAGQSQKTPILLLDTLGELGVCWGLADVAFVGGSLTRRGGQNMIEPAAYGAAVLFGPNTWNFRDVVELLLNSGAARVVADREELTNTVGELLRDEAAAVKQGQIAQRLVVAQQGATAKTSELLVQLAGPIDVSQSRAA